MNPFDNTVGIKEPTKLIGRLHETRRIHSAIANHQCISLDGLPRIGKTSMLKCLPFLEAHQEFEQKLGRCIFVYVDLEEHIQKTPKEFFEILSRYIAEQSRKSLELEYNAGRGAESFIDILEQIFEQNYHLVLEIDMFDGIIKNEEFDEAFLGFLRAQVNMRGISYVTASRAPLYEISRRFAEGSPFFNIFGRCHIDLLTRTDAEKLAMMPSSQEDCTFSEEEVKWVCELAGRHPFLIQRVCYYLYEESFLHTPTKIKQNDVENQAYTALLPSFYDIWKSLTLEEQEALKYAVQREGAQWREFSGLAESALYRKFVRDTWHVEPLNKFEELERILEEIDNPKYLGESNLIYLNIVSQNYKQDTSPSTIIKGKAVRQVLKEAFEHLSGPGYRTDTDSMWMHYNILYYRYFRHHMKNEHIAARLGFSTRQYYRERIKAIEVLSQVLQEMEDSAINHDHE